MSSTGTNSAASARQRLSKIATARGVDFQQILVSYAIERLLYRLSISAQARNFILKGATLFTLWEGFPHRQTRDLDLLGFGENTALQLESTFREIIQYGGVRVHLMALLEKARITVSVDVGFGDSIVPAPKEVDFPTLLDFPKPRVRAYPPETVVAEKLQAAVTLGLANSRMKDFFDLWHLGQTVAFEGPVLCAAVTATFLRRRTPIPAELPLALSDTFAMNPIKIAQWNGFVGKTVTSREHLELGKVVAFLRVFLEPVVVACRSSHAGLKRWPPGGPWADGSW